MNFLTTEKLQIKNTGLLTHGILFIGDPHMWSKRPGRRKDDSFLDTLLGKLEFIVGKSNELKLWPIITGDFFHEDDDSDPEMLIKIIKVIQKFERKPLTIVGNHEINEWILTEDNALSLLKITKQMDVIDKNGFWGQLEITDKETGNSKIISIGGTPYGQKIPYDLTQFIGMEGTSFREELDSVAIEKSKNAVRSAATRGNAPLLQESNTNDDIKPNIEIHNEILKKLNCDKIIWLTHHDLAFEGTYPNSLPLHNIDGVDMLINGHIHGTKKPVLVGNTACYNPGNITRLSIDMADHKPSVWLFDPFDDKGMASSKGIRVPRLEQIIIPHKSGKEIFNYEGKHVKSSLVDEDFENIDLTNSVFVELLKKETISEKTDDAIYVRESLDSIYEKYEVKDSVKIVVNSLLNRVLGEKRNE